MKKLLGSLPLVTFLLAALLMFAADRLSQPALTFIGLMLLGFSALLSGVQVIVTRQAFFLPTGRQSLKRRAESYSGLAAQLWGVFFVLFGLICVLAALAGLFAPEQAQAVVDQALETPAGWGVLLTILGVFLSLYGLTRLLSGSASVSTGFQIQLRDAGYRLFGGVCLLLGLALVALGLTLITSPEMLNDLIRQWIPGLP
jgi:hypothetical protein